MEILRSKADLKEHLKNIKKKGKKIGFIPTMGGIHKGHLSLIRESLALKLHSVSSIFVNSLQFNDYKDFLNYPKNELKDIELLSKNNCSTLYLPNTNDIYPEGVKVTVKVKEYRNILCDKYRSGHFDGVTTVVKSLFNLVNPDHVFFGEKDFQQLKLIEKLIEKDALPILVHPCISVRMSNGMSFSSRYKNFLLSQKKTFNKVAQKIMNNLIELKKEINVKIIENLKKELNKINIDTIDYLEIRDEINLLPTVKNTNARLFVAFYIDNIRIIDNFILY